MHTGNIIKVFLANNFYPVYPCAYREHIANKIDPMINSGLSLCIQGTSSSRVDNIVLARFIPVHTGNITSLSLIPTNAPVYPCAYREHNCMLVATQSYGGLSLCIQGTYQL